MNRWNRKQWAICVVGVLLALGMAACPPWREKTQHVTAVYDKNGFTYMGGDGGVTYAYIGYAPLWADLQKSFWEREDDEPPAHWFAPRRFWTLGANYWRQPDLLLLGAQELVLLLGCLFALRRAGSAPAAG